MNTGERDFKELACKTVRAGKSKSAGLISRLETQAGFVF